MEISDKTSQHPSFVPLHYSFTLFKLKLKKLLKNSNFKMLSHIIGWSEASKTSDFGLLSHKVSKNKVSLKSEIHRSGPSVGVVWFLYGSPFNIYDEWAFQWYQTFLGQISSSYTLMDMFRNFLALGVPQKYILSTISGTRTPSFLTFVYIVW